MAIYVGSRYETGVIGFITDHDGVSRLSVLRNEKDQPGVVTRTYYTVAGDRLDYLAARFYNRSDLWWLIADANADLLLVDPIQAGLLLRIPDAPDRI